MSDWSDRAFFKSTLITSREAEFKNDGYDELSTCILSMIREYINKFDIYIDGTLVSVTTDNNLVNFFVVYPDVETFNFVKDVVIGDIINGFDNYLQPGKLIDLYIPDIINQTIQVSKFPNINITYKYPGLYVEPNNNNNYDEFWGFQKVANVYYISVKFDKLVCTFNQTIHLYKLADTDVNKIRNEIKMFVRPIVNLLSLVCECPSVVSEALDVISNINFMTHSSINANLKTAKSINGFVKFCKCFPCEKSFNEACQEVVKYDNLFKKMFEIKRTRNYIGNNGRVLIYSNFGINITPNSNELDIRIWNQRLEPTLNSLRSVAVLLIMFGEFEKFKTDVEKTLLRIA